MLVSSTLAALRQASGNSILAEIILQNCQECVIVFA
ncbi:uncharacterized protein METZ01_LOCUS401447, partial [marine metagenome]